MYFLGTPSGAWRSQKTLSEKVDNQKLKAKIIRRSALNVQISMFTLLLLYES